ncbi:uncharacterized protein LTR77_008565 [Saxophila tyrrhenica]|uniref:Protein kinase domain-containing protein n=1 Tax=Saxophila tyrrhenica TaxID=1690608 RepID=A0AAV9P394_9PEZI|nr:hypothetical protein LTR77_008565 [Saxophila tyrrhenica]
MAEEPPSDFLHPKSASAHDIEHRQEGDHGISINLPPDHDGRPPPVRHISAPTYQSPIRHHRRAPSRSKGVKETLNARSQYGSSDDASVHRINQYNIKQEIGRGSFGAVHLAVDQFGHEFAVKEFSKSRLRKRAQSNLLRKPNQPRRAGHIAAGFSFNAPLHLGANGHTAEANNSLSLIKEEIAIMKKLDHNNLVSLIEVLDDPQEDSLYMVLEMCKKGVAMHVGLDERAQPYQDETCRCWFRDMILGIEYLHAQGIIHRDIKPDNCLITNDDVLKIVDFGVSEMFEKQSEMTTTKSAGSPAFMPPELCVAKHGQVSGRAADIWSMGVTLYCLRYGHIPFEKGSIMELYDSIRGDELPLGEEQDANFADLMKRMLEKDPEKRITMDQLRQHPWVTRNGTDQLLSAKENCADIIEPPSQAEMDHAITGNMGNILAVVKAAKRFRKIISDKRGRFIDGIFGRDSNFVLPPHTLRSHSQDDHDRHPLDKILVTSGVQREYGENADLEKVASDLDDLQLVQSPEASGPGGFERSRDESKAHYKQRQETASHHPSLDEHAGEMRSRIAEGDGHARGQAHDPLEDNTYLAIGVDPEAPGNEDYLVVSESPPAVDMNIYEQAYQDEMERILQRRGGEPSIYMTRRVEHRDDIRALSNIKDAGKHAVRRAALRFDRLSSSGFATTQEASDAGRSAARSAADKLSGKWATGSTSASEYLEPWKQTAKDTASRGYGKMGDIYSKSGGGGGKISDLVSRAQAKYRGEGSESSVPAKQAEATQQDATTTGQPDEASVTPAAPELPTVAPGGSEQPKDDTSSTPAALPVKSAFTEHII